jgi:carboxypeptidase PM20D1
MLRRIIIGATAVVFAVVAIVVGRAMMVPSLDPVAAETAVETGFDAGKLADRLAEAVRLRTISWQDGASPADIEASRQAFVSLRNWIETTYPVFSQTATREIVGDYSLLFTWKGSDPTLKPVLLMSHMDVVPVAPGSEDRWTHPPFEGKVADGYAWGRGTLDTKAGIITQLEAAEALMRQGFTPKRTIMFAYGHDEELGGREGNMKIAALLAERKTALDMVVDEGGFITRGVVNGIDRPVALVGIAEKGYVSLDLTARSAGGHSSVPLPIHETAIGRLARAIGRLEDHPFESRIDGVTKDFLLGLMPAMTFGRKLAVANLWMFEPVLVAVLQASPSAAATLHTTIAPTIIRGGNKENVLPPEATVTVNFRVHPRDTIDSVVAHVHEAVDDPQVDIRISNPGREPSATSDAKSAQFALIAGVLQKVSPAAVVAPNLVPAGTDSRHYAALTRNIFRIIPIEVTAEEVKGFHGTDERVPVKSLATAAKFYRVLIEDAGRPRTDAR